MTIDNIVRVRSEGGIGMGTTVSNIDTGEELNHIEKIAIPMFGCSDVVRIELVIGLASLDIEGKPVFQVMHPKTGEIKQVKSIAFEDGEVFP